MAAMSRLFGKLRKTPAPATGAAKTSAKRTTAEADDPSRVSPSLTTHEGVLEHARGTTSAADRDEPIFLRRGHGQPEAGHPFDAASQDGVTLGGLLAALWRAKLAIVSFTALCGLVALTVLLSVRPQYESNVRVLVEPAASMVPSRGDGLGTQGRERLILDAEAVASQVELVRSRDVAMKVIEELDLASKLDFTAPSALESLLEIVGISRDEASLTEQAMKSYAKSLRVFHIPDTRVIGIAFRSYDPELAAEGAAAVAQTYLAEQVRDKSSAAEAATAWLGDEIDRLRDRVAEAERRVQVFRAGAGLLRGVNDETLPAQRLSELNTQLAAARSARIDAEGKAAQLRRSLEAQAGDGLVDAVEAPLMQRLMERRSDLRAQLADLSTTLGPSHPRIRQLTAQLGELGGQVRSEALRLAEQFDEDARTAQARENLLQAELGTLETEAADAEYQDVELQALEREAKAQRDLLESLLGRYREASTNRNPAAQSPDARIISGAAVPLEPAFPKTGPTLLAVVFGAFILACGVAGSATLLRQETPRAGRDRLPAHPRGEADPTAVEPEQEPVVSFSRSTDRPVENAPIEATEPTGDDGSTVEKSDAPTPLEGEREPAEGEGRPAPDTAAVAASTAATGGTADILEASSKPESDEFPHEEGSLAAIAQRFSAEADRPAIFMIVAPAAPVGAQAGLVFADEMSARGRGTLCIDAGRHAPGLRLEDLLYPERDGELQGEPRIGMTDLAAGADIERAVQKVPGSSVHAVLAGTGEPRAALAAPFVELFAQAYDAVVLLVDAAEMPDLAGLRFGGAVLLSDGCDEGDLEAALSVLAGLDIEDIVVTSTSNAVAAFNQAA